MKIASARVVTAIDASAAMMSVLRLSRSAHTPPKIDTIAWGSMPNTADAMSTTPDLVSSVRCHMIAYCTSIDPNIDTVCPDRNTAVSRLHPARGTAVSPLTARSSPAPQSPRLPRTTEPGDLDDAGFETRRAAHGAPQPAEC